MDRNSSDIFCLKVDPDTNNTNQIFSVRGSPSFRINRKPEYSTVFPTPELKRVHTGKRSGPFDPTAAGPAHQVHYRGSSADTQQYPNLSPGRESPRYPPEQPRGATAAGMSTAEFEGRANRQYNEEMDVDGMEMPQMSQVVQPRSPKFAVPSVPVGHSARNLSSMPRNILTGEGMDTEVVRNQCAARKTQQWTW